MKRRLVLALLATGMLLALAAPASASAEELLGRWQITGLTIGGEDQGEGDFLRSSIAFYADGTLKTFVDGEPDGEGHYEVEGDQLKIYHDGAVEPEVSTFARDGETLTMTQDIMEGVEAVVTLARVGDAD